MVRVEDDPFVCLWQLAAEPSEHCGNLVVEQEQQDQHEQDRQAEDDPVLHDALATAGALTFRAGPTWWSGGPPVGHVASFSRQPE